MKKRKEKRTGKTILSLILVIFAFLCIAAILYLGNDLKKRNSKSTQSTDLSQKGAAVLTSDTPAEDSYTENEAEAAVTEPPLQQNDSFMAGDILLHEGYTVKPNENTVVPKEEEILSTNSLLLDLSSDTVVAAKAADQRISPASMTKILTVLVAAEQITELDSSFTVTSEMTAYCLKNGCSAAGFVGGENVSVRDLFYGTILPSGGEAAVALATCAAGSQEAFVNLMNQKLEALGLSDTAHFTNCVGIYDENHYCTLYDMAIILKAAIQNDWAREVLSTKVHTTVPTEQNPEGIVLSNWFLRRIEDKDCGGEVICAKTGYVEQSGDCAASYAISSSGKPYICVTANTYSSWRCIYDHVALYKLYAL